MLKYIVRPAARRRHPGDKLIISFHFTVRSGVALQVILANWDGGDGVAVWFVMNDDAYTPAPLPNKRDWNITVDDLKRLNPDAASAYEGVIFGALLANPITAPVLAKGILTDRYDAPVASSAYDTEVTTSVDGLPKSPHFSVDDGQPFPIYGFLDVKWERHPSSEINATAVSPAQLERYTRR